MSNRKKMKGFTLVELLVVIAIIAILATVSVVGYLSFTKKAKESNDISMTTQMNTVLESAKSTDGDNETCYDAVQDLKANGIIIDDLEPYSDGYKYLWNSKNDSMVLYDDSGELVAGELDDATNDELFAFIDSEEELSAYTSTTTSDYTDSNVAYADSDTTLYSIYLTTNFTGTVPTISVNVSVDTGAQAVDVTYSATVKSDVYVRTNGGNLKISVTSGEGTLAHYGTAASVTVSTAGTYSESGTTVELSVTSGTVTVESGATIAAATAASGTKITIASGAKVSDVLNNGATIEGASTDTKVYTDENEYNTAKAEAVSKVQAEAFESDPNNDSYVARIGLKGYDTVIDAVSGAASGDTIVLLSDTVVNESILITKSLTLDLNGKTITNEEEIWSDAYTANVTVSGENVNLTITGNGTLKALANDCYCINVIEAATVTIENGTFMGNVSAIFIERGTAIIEGGTFSLIQKYNGGDKYLLNCYDTTYAAGAASIVVSGGEFEEFDPTNCSAEGTGTNFCADGYTATATNKVVSGTTYTYYVVSAN